jgi:hypothetical protein
VIGVFERGGDHVACGCTRLGTEGGVDPEGREQQDLSWLLNDYDAVLEDGPEGHKGGAWLGLRIWAGQFLVLLLQVVGIGVEWWITDPNLASCQ